MTDADLESIVIDAQMALETADMLRGHPTMNVKLIREGAQLPKRAHVADAGLDLFCCADVRLEPGTVTCVPTGISVEIPFGYEGQIRHRSSLASNGILTPTGTVDCDYRGEIHVIFHNASGGPYTIVAGQRMAQLVIAQVALVAVAGVPELTETKRGEGGFGSTGK